LVPIGEWALFALSGGAADASGGGSTGTGAAGNSAGFDDDACAPSTPVTAALPAG
jgi:hypothetical protein